MKNSDPNNKVSSSEKRVRRIGIGIVLGVFGVFLTWAILAPISSAVVANGEVRVELGRISLQHLEGGILKKVYIRDGDEVKAGDPLIELEGTLYRAEFEVLNKQLNSLKVMEARLLAERNDERTFAAPVELDRSDPQAQLLVTNEHALMEARRYALEREIGVLQERLKQVESQTRGLRHVSSNKEAIRVSLLSEIEDLRRLVEREFISRHRLNQIERQLSGIDSEISENRAAMANLMVQKQEALQTIAFRVAERKANVMNDLSDARKRINELESRKVSIQDRLNRTVLRATTDGQILAMRYPVPGAVLPPGASVVDILPPN